MAELPTSEAELPQVSVGAPAWLLSLVLHLLLLIGLAWLIRPVPRGAADEPGREVGIVLKQKNELSDTFFDSELAQSQDRSESSPVDVNDVIAALPTEASGLDPTSALPSRPTLLGPGALPDGGVGGAADLTQAARQPRQIASGRARVSLYGLPPAEGTKFVYVFDRSSSMAGPPLASAKRQLLASLESLQSNHQFHIVFFNHRPTLFDLSGGQDRIPFASQRTKELARQFVESITADRGTDRLAALEIALGMRPDVIFFLTDADDPMTGSELERVRKKNRGASMIQTIDFGYGPTQQQNNFLVRLARMTGGHYVYIDTSKLGP